MYISQLAIIATWRAVYAATTLSAGDLTMKFHDNTKPEPLNVVISAASYGEISHEPASSQFKDWLSAIGFSDSCLGKSGQPQYSDLQDGRGEQVQQLLVRQNFHWNGIGSCGETFLGGNHCRGFHQATTSHWFLGCSVEKNLLRHHTIAGDGYNAGRKDFVNAAAKGGKHGRCTWPPATVEILSAVGLRSPDGSLYNHNVPVDGDVAYVTVIAPSC